MLISDPSQETLVSQTVADAAGAAPSKGAREGTLGRYALLGRVGAGAMGEVYAAYDPELDRRVAIKVLHATRLQRPDAVLRLRREAQALARLRHENVVAVHDVGSAQGVTFVAMEFVEGETLRRWLRGRRSRDEIVAAFVAAGRGLLAAHERGLVHRDFKPENVMIDATGRVVVMDFGLARADDTEAVAGEGSSSGLQGLHQQDRDDSLGTALGSGSEPTARSGNGSRAPGALIGSETGSLTRTGAVMGTPAYMSPEQHLGQSADARSDQFAWCVALWEALYEVRPFAGGSMAKLAYAVTQGELQLPPASVGVAVRVQKALERGLSVRVADRWPDMGELIEAVKPPSRARAWPWTLGLGLAGLSILALVITRPLWGARAEVPACPDYAAELQASWGEPARARLAKSFEAAPIAWRGDALARTQGGLDRFAAQLADTRATACRETRLQATQSDEAMDLRMACTAAREAAAQSLIEVLDGADVSALAKGPTAATALLDPQSCLDVASLRAAQGGAPLAGYAHADEAERALTRIFALRSTGQAEQALVALGELGPKIDAQSGAALRARAAFARGELLIDTRDKQAAPAELARAFAFATEAGNRAVAADAAALMIRALGELRRDFDGAARWADIAAGVDIAAGTSVERVARRENNLGIAYDTAGDYAAARKHFEAAVQRYSEAFGERDVRVSSPLNNLGISLELTHKYAEARVAYERALSIMQEGLGPSHPRVGRVHNNLSSLLQAIGDKQGALEHSNQAVLIAQGAFGVGAPATASAFVNRCWAKLYLRRIEAAQIDCAHALAILTEAYGQDSVDRVNALVPTAWSHELEERPGVAAEVYAEILALDFAAEGDEGSFVCIDRSNLAHVYAKAGQWAKARDFALASLKHAREQEELPDCGARAHYVMALVYEHAGDLPAARESLELARAHYADFPPGYAFEKDNIAKLFGRIGPPRP